MDVHQFIVRQTPRQHLDQHGTKLKQEALPLGVAQLDTTHLGHRNEFVVKQEDLVFGDLSLILVLVSLFSLFCLVFVFSAKAVDEI